ncbi:hypothetical protein HDU91_001415 [Kappamyces sp. JEL0680]|nr:hypothetical protein HDU91_001415 [Kappamyces sp. JEL0680]
MASAFGQSLFTSTWEPAHANEGPPQEASAFLNFDDRYAPAVEEPEDINALSRTIGLLGLDDSISPAEHNVTSEFQPYSERRRPELARPRSISVSFPAISPDVDAYTQSPFGRTISSMAIMTETPAGMVPRAHSPEQAETFQSKSGIPSQTSPALAQSGLDRSNSINNDINSPEVSSPSRSIWIGNLDTNLGSDDLGSIFVRFGAIESVRVLPEKECAFVNYVRLEDALDAKEQMQGARLGNCVVRIGFGKTDAIQDTQTMQPTKSLWVGNLAPNTKPAELELAFSKFGTVESARVLTHKNCGFVNFVSLEDAISARQQLNGQDLGGSVLKINFAKVPPKPDPPLTPAQALANPGVLSKLVAGAVERSANAWQKDQCVGNKQSRKDFAGTHMYADSEASSFFASDLQDDILSIPEIIPSRKHDQSRLRELRKKLEGNVSPKDFDAIFIEIIDDADDLCSDYIGNVIIQKIMEKASDPQRLQLIEKVSHLMAALGIHKNGTWAVQKIIDLAKSISHIDAIVAALTPYAPALLLDQFGNYVVQCCLRLGSTRNQFIFDAISSKICQVGQGRFGARATKACLDSSYTTKRQQKQVSLAIVQNCVQLSMNSNGSILLTWLMDVSVLPGRYRVLAPIMIPHLQMLACHKLASVSLLKIVNQRVELDARELILKEIFEKESNLSYILSDGAVGVPFITKILSTGCVSMEEKAALAASVQKVGGSRQKLDGGIKRLLDDVCSTPDSYAAVSRKDDRIGASVVPPPAFFQDLSSPTRAIPTTSQAAEEPLPPKYPMHLAHASLPTPNQSPTYPMYPPQSPYAYRQPYYPSPTN